VLLRRLASANPDAPVIVATYARALKDAGQIDAALAVYLPRWRDAGYEVILTADHGQTPRGHHGGTTEAMREVPLYYFGAASGPTGEEVLCQTQVAPSVLTLLGVPVPPGMRGAPIFA